MFTQQKHHGSGTQSHTFHENRKVYLEIAKYLPALKPWANPSEVATLNYSTDSGDYSARGRKRAKALPHTPIKDFGEWAGEEIKDLLMSPFFAIDLLRRTTARLVEGAAYIPSEVLAATVRGSASTIKAPFKFVKAITASILNKVYWAWGLTAQTGTRLVMLSTDMVSEGIVLGANANVAMDKKTTEQIDATRDNIIKSTGETKRDILKLIGGENFKPMAANDDKEVAKKAA